MLHNARAIEAVEIRAGDNRGPRDRGPSMDHGKIVVDEQAQDVGMSEPEERLREEGDGGGPTVLNIRVVRNVVDGHVLGEGLGEV